MSRISIDIGETGGRTNLAIQKQILCVTDKVIGRERKLIVHKGKVNTDICLLIGFPFQVGINSFVSVFVNLLKNVLSVPTTLKLLSSIFPSFPSSCRQVYLLCFFCLIFYFFYFLLHSYIFNNFICYTYFYIFFCF